MAHTYTANLSWQGSTRDGYRAYSRTHTASAPPAQAELGLTSDPAYRGDPEHLNPEQLLLMSASSCQLLSFLAEAALAGVDVLSYDDSAEAVMEKAGGPMRITKIVLRPIIRVAEGTDVAAVVPLVQRAHEGCFIANSLTSTIEIEPRIES